MLSDLEKAEKIVYQLMYSKDRFSQWLGIDILEVMPGKCTLRAKIKPEMLNGFNICHGGITLQWLIVLLHLRAIREAYSPCRLRHPFHM